jgi:membrane associated rhomboid family serine protease
VTLFTSMFVHAGFLYVAGNMLYPWNFGANVPRRALFAWSDGPNGGPVGYLTRSFESVLLVGLSSEIS